MKESAAHGIRFLESLQDNACLDLRTHLRPTFQQPLLLSDGSDSDTSSISEEADSDTIPTGRVPDLQSCITADLYFSSVLSFAISLFDLLRPSMARLRLPCLSVVFLALTPRCLLSCAGEPLCLISRTSMLLSSLLFVLITSLSEEGTHTVHHLTKVSYAVFLALFIHIERPFPAMVLLYLSTLWSSALLGYAVAEHHQQYLSADDIRSPWRRPGPPIRSLSGVSFACALRVLWVACTYAAAEADAAVLEFSFTASVCLYLWASLVHVWLLHSSFVDGDFLIMILNGFAMLYVVLTGIVQSLFGDPGFVFLNWLIAMGSAGVLGYTVGIYHSCERRFFITRLDECKLPEEMQVEQLIKSSNNDSLEGADMERLTKCNTTEQSESCKKVKEPSTKEHTD